jgi:8-oxo-dGTP diphosphatase
MKKYVLGFMFSNDLNDVLLIEKTHPENQKGKLNGIGGHINENENSFDAMVREFKEETSIETDTSEWVYSVTMRGVDFSVSCFATKSDKIYSKKTITEEEVIICAVHSISVLKDLFRDVDWLIPLSRECLSRKIIADIRFEWDKGNSNG